MGATQKSQSWESAAPPTKTAGPKLLAGLTDVPVIGIPTKCISTRDKPIDRPAKPLGDSLLVEPKITNRNNAVRTISVKQHAAKE